MTNYMQFSLHRNTMTLSVCVCVLIHAYVCVPTATFFSSFLSLVFFHFFSNEICCRVRGHTHRVEIPFFLIIQSLLFQLVAAES